jgi:hypothetical protein
VRSPRNHARRVEDLQRLEQDGLLKFVESRRPEGGTWEYVVSVRGEAEQQAIPTARIDVWLRAFRSALTALAHGRAGHAAPSTTTAATEER